VVTEAQPAAAVIRRRRVAETRRYHTIQSGDTLGRLAMQFYGDPLLWTRIAETNNIANPDLIFPGQVFLIP
jgi:nucleoid-associated protein YgaU